MVLDAARVGDDSWGDPGPRWADSLLDEVDRAFEKTGANTPGWPDPHPERDPLEEEYSRVTDVSKYRILGSRVDAWVTVVTDRGIAGFLDVPAEPWIDGRRPPDRHQRVLRFEPVATGALRLLVATTLVDGRPFGVDVGVSSRDGRPVLLAMVPDCGCDACDSGSADLLRELDGWVLTVARGGVVHARRGEHTATRSWGGWCTANRGDASWLDESAPAIDGLQRWMGAPWV